MLAIFTSIFQKPEKYDKKYFSCQNFTIFIICTLYLIRIDKILGWKLLGFIFLFHFLQIKLKDLLAFLPQYFKSLKNMKKNLSCQNFTVFIIYTLYLIRIDKILGWKLLGFIILFQFLQIKLKDLLAVFTSIFQKPEKYEKEFVMSKFYNFYNLYIIPDQDS